MAATLGDVDPRQIARLRTELCEVIAATLAYPSFYDFRIGQVRVRPLGAAKRSEIARFVGGLDFGPAAELEPGSLAMRQFLEQNLQRFVEFNGGDMGASKGRRLGALRTAVRAGATSSQRELVAALAGTPNQLGAARPLVTWSDARAAERFDGRKRGEHVEPVEHADHDGQVLQHVLTGNGQSPSNGDTPKAKARAEAEPESANAPGAIGRHGRGRVARPTDSTELLATASPTMADVVMAATAAGSRRSGAVADVADGRSPFAGLELGSQSSIFAVPDDISERATAAPQAVRRVTGQPADGRPISPPPPQLARLYEAYVYGHGSEAVESRPTAGPATLAAAMADMADVRTSPHPAPVEMPAPASGVAAGLPSERTDAMVFGQLRNQIETYVRMAAQNYGVATPTGDPALTLDALRQSGHVEEADLRMAEGILAITDRVGASGTASLDDYRQALMLYLLYHRGKVGV